MFFVALKKKSALAGAPAVHKTKAVATKQVLFIGLPSQSRQYFLAMLCERTIYISLGFTALLVARPPFRVSPPKVAEVTATIVQKTTVGINWGKYVY